MDFLEKDLEDVVYEAYQTGNQDFLRERGLSCFYHDYVIRQLNLGDYGIADLVGIDLIPDIDKKEKSFIIVTIYELKKDTISMATFSQILKYGKAICSFLKLNGMSDGYMMNYVIIGRSLSNSDNLCFMNDIFRTIKTYTYNYSFDGIRFNPTNGYVLGTGNTGVWMKNKKRELMKLFILKKKELQAIRDKEQELEEIESDKDLDEYFKSRSLSVGF